MLLKKRGLLLVLVFFTVTVSTWALGGLAAITPLACALCHAPEAERLHVSTHKNISCRSCHFSPGFFGFVSTELDLARMATAKLLGNYAKPVRAQVDDEACGKCHSKIRKGVLKRDGIKMEHGSVIAKGISCLDCHNTIAHGAEVPLPKKVTMDKCTSCHEGDGDKPVDCRVCHERQWAQRPTSKVGDWARVHGKEWRKTHGMGDLKACSACHPSAQCASCHVQMPHPEGWPVDHSKTARGKTDDACLKCHQDSFCLGCHRVEMPHPAGYLKRHSAIVKGRGGNGADDCYSCHIKEDCVRCHDRHVHAASYRIRGK